MANFADWQLNTYFAGLGGAVPEHPFTSRELAARAEAAMDRQLWDYVVGGAGDEATQDANVEAFGRYGLMPRMLSGAAARDLSTTLWGIELASPVFMAPVGVIGLCAADQHGDLAAARAAAAVGVPLVGSTLMQDPLEEVARQLGETPGFFQLYTPNDREVAESLAHRAEAAGYRALVVTLDTWTLGYRPRDLQHGIFPQLKGACLANYASDPVFRSRLPKTPEEDPMGFVAHWAMTFGNPTLTWEDVAWLRGLTDLPLVLKGICSPDDVRRAVDAGVDGIYCSNHGGRQAASAPALEFLPSVVAAAGDLPVLFDSGIRSGVDVVKALALGATAVGIGRPYAYAAAAASGDAAGGIEHLLRWVLAEADLTMGLNGYASIAALREAGAVFRL
ncbi:alpha-hydroxy-acid oxidizing protein [Nocardioides sp. Kera G14]|uniref:alpha-hydroxy-acid oxidizing protein n=1 Tax=Nocardioides sp. Kera G14 TaxID=2884264 RepID=UPI001D12379A|nr:alpha-hydroxy-acid oxidizing protein [Nocardioides sp. Kera G14]UDY23733.1 alpha-hydroxy-acid oxidizing protein [Nocardioides sp. Kera G14]